MKPELEKNGLDGMVDIETLSTNTNAVILSIGAIKFDPQRISSEEELSKHSFYMNVDRNDCAFHGLHTSSETVTWWEQQSKEANNALLTDPQPLTFALTRFMQFMHAEPRINKLWANSPSFDCIILREAFNAVNIMWPFPFWQDRDVRTIKDMAFPNGDAPNFILGTAHNALDDCIGQARCVQACHHIIGQIPKNEYPIL